MKVKVIQLIVLFLGISHEAQADLLADTVKCVSPPLISRTFLKDFPQADAIIENVPPLAEAYLNNLRKSSENLGPDTNAKAILNIENTMKNVSLDICSIVNTREELSHKQQSLTALEASLNMKLVIFAMLAKRCYFNLEFPKINLVASEARKGLLSRSTIVTSTITKKSRFEVSVGGKFGEKKITKIISESSEIFSVYTTDLDRHITYISGVVKDAIKNEFAYLVRSEIEDMSDYLSNFLTRAKGDIKNLGTLSNIKKHKTLEEYLNAVQTQLEPLVRQLNEIGARTCTYLEALFIKLYKPCFHRCGTMNEMMAKYSTVDFYTPLYELPNHMSSYFVNNAESTNRKTLKLMQKQDFEGSTPIAVDILGKNKHQITSNATKQITKIKNLLNYYWNLNPIVTEFIITYKTICCLLWKDFIREVRQILLASEKAALIAINIFHATHPPANIDEKTILEIAYTPISSPYIVDELDKAITDKGISYTKDYMSAQVKRITTEANQKMEALHLAAKTVNPHNVQQIAKTSFDSKFEFSPATEDKIEELDWAAEKISPEKTAEISFDPRFEFSPTAFSTSQDIMSRIDEMVSSWEEGTEPRKNENDLLKLQFEFDKFVRYINEYCRQHYNLIFELSKLEIKKKGVHFGNV